MSGTMMDDRLRELFDAQASAVQPSEREWGDVVVDELAARRARRSGWSTGVVVAAACLVLVAAIGWVATRAREHPAAAGEPVRFVTEGVLLTADSITIEVEGLTFFPTMGSVIVSGDPDELVQSLELEWTQHGELMRMNIYFSRDEERWQVDSMRVYDLETEQQWIESEEPIDIGAAIEHAWTGDVDMVLGSGNRTAKVVMRGVEVEPYRNAIPGLRLPTPPPPLIITDTANGEPAGAIVISDMPLARHSARLGVPERC